MNKRILLLGMCVAIAALFGGCRQDEMRTFDDNYVEISADLCSNGVQDGTETDIDCGGSCGICNAVDIPCILAPDEFYIDGVLQTFFLSYVYSDEIRISYTGGFSLTMKFEPDGVEPGVIYPCTGSSPSADNVRVFANYGSEFWYYSGNNQKLYLEGSAYDLSVSFCDLELTSNLTGIVHTINGNKTGVQ